MFFEIKLVFITLEYCNGWKEIDRGILNVYADWEQEEEHAKAQEYRGEQTDQQLLEDDTLLPLAAVLTGPAHLEHEEPRGEEGSNGDQDSGEHWKRSRRNRGCIPHHRVHFVCLWVAGREYDKTRWELHLQRDYYKGYYSFRVQTGKWRVSILTRTHTTAN